MHHIQSVEQELMQRMYLLTIADHDFISGVYMIEVETVFDNTLLEQIGII